MVGIKEKLNIYKGKRVFLTGHTGFKGSWMAKWLIDLGAEVKGFSLAPNTEPSHFKLLNLDMDSTFENIGNLKKLTLSMQDFKPDIVFHMAAQPLVRYSYENPIETYQTNVMGTLNVFEAIRKVKSVKAIVNITTDKCYKNLEKDYAYKETDEMGGYDPYSSSKACSEILTDSYRNSYFNLNDFKSSHETLMASARSGNVIGGGDWSEDRIIPDIVQSKITGNTLDIRNPSAVRPWQHVLEPLSGYLTLGSHLLNGEKEFASAWNFGPAIDQVFTVGDIVNAGNKIFNNSLNVKLGNPGEHPHEASLLMLDPKKANDLLGWKSVLDFKATVDLTFDWYQQFLDAKTLETENNIKTYYKYIN